MTGRRGFSLVEMVIVLVLAGIVSTAAISMFSTQNRLNAHMTALGESQENARSAVQLAAAEMRTASGGAVVAARADHLTLRVPIVVGLICGEQNPQTKSVYFPLDGRDFDLAQADGYAFRSVWGDWSPAYAVRQSDGFRTGARQHCVDRGAGTLGGDGDYATLRVGGSYGNAVMLFREVSYYFAPSALDPSRRAFYRATPGETIELAQGFSNDTRFEYQLSDTTWRPALSTADDIRHVKAVRVLAQVVVENTSGSATGRATFSLTREIRLRNAQ